MGASPVDPPLAAFFTTFFFGTSVGVPGSDGVVGVVGDAGATSVLSDTEDSICAAVEGFPLGLTPICASDTGGVGTWGSSTVSRVCSTGGGGEVTSAEGDGEVRVVLSSLAMMD